MEWALFEDVEASGGCWVKEGELESIFFKTSIFCKCGWKSIIITEKSPSASMVVSLFFDKTGRN